MVRSWSSWRVCAAVLVSFCCSFAGVEWGRATAAGAAAAGCATNWGSVAKSDGRGPVPSPLTNVRAGQQPCFERLVLDVAGPMGGFDVRYVAEVVEDGSGRTVPLRGRAFLRIVLRAPASDAAGRPTYTPANRSELVPLAGYRTLRQAAWAGSFEGVTTIGLGVRARLPMRAFVLAGPGTGSRLVIDVADAW